jgi:hypothetical protein
MRAVFLIVVLSLLSVEGASQTPMLSMITGLVRDSVTGQPVDNVNVFLSSTTLGVGTDRDGRYALTSIPKGRYTLIYSRVGYVLKAMGVVVEHSDTIISNVVIAPKLIVLGDVEVSAEAAREFQKNLVSFSRIFLGAGPNAQHCEIANPEALDLQCDPHSGMLVATADEPLRIFNKALGYELQISLAEFHWDTNLDFGAYLIYPRFRSLGIESGIDTMVRKKNRAKTYEGSFQHFLRALVTGDIESEGFVVYGGALTELQAGRGTHVFPDAIQPEILPGSALMRWVFDGWLRVDRMGDIDSRPSYISLEGFGAFIDHHGILDNPLSVRLLGRWAGERVAHMLPLNE